MNLHTWAVIFHTALSSFLHRAFYVTSIKYAVEQNKTCLSHSSGDNRTIKTGLKNASHNCTRQWAFWINHCLWIACLYLSGLFRSRWMPMLKTLCIAALLKHAGTHCCCLPCVFLSSLGDTLQSIRFISESKLNKSHHSLRLSSGVPFIN